ncbi:MAG: hypothetical protein LUI39_01095 [Lachnospiraceae bacterium]|nr:hypothetical protein [Lachnospiraceae bacterium]
MRKLRKIAAVLLTAALLVQQCSVTGFAEEGQTTETQAATEAQTQAATEAQTQAATEAQTQAATEAQTQAATEAQTQAATEAQTQSSAGTEAQTSADETQAATEAQTQTSAETEAQTSADETQESATEAETAESGKQTSSKNTGKKETEETERSERENSGDKLKLKNLVEKLSSVLSYLFVAETVTIPDELTADAEEAVTTETPSEDTAELAASANAGETAVSAVSEEAAAVNAVSEDAETASGEDAASDMSFEEELNLEDLILDGDEGKALLTDLKKLSISLADAKTSKSVTVINLYADEDGNLDEAQLEALFSDKVLDVTDMAYVINIVADSAKQDLTFSGYAMKRSDKTVDYEDAFEAGDVIYNFVALEDDDYADYTGTLKLSDGIQGTVLAPAATVEVAGDLSGAVYASSVTVKDAEAALLRVAFSTGAEEETEAGTEAATETEAVTETEAGTETAAETESETTAATETESETEGSLRYAVPLTVTLNVLDRDGTALAGNETFYVNVYSDAARTQTVTVYTDSTMATAANSSTPIAISMDGSSTQTVTFVLEATAEEQTFYIGETDSTGAEVAGGVSGFAYNVSYPDTNANAVTVRYGDTAAAVTVQNQLNDSTVKISVRDSSDGGLLSGAKLAIKDSSGKIYEVSTVGSKTFTSGEAEIVWTNALTDGETYYLTEITAPDGYTPVPDVAFTVVRGCTTEVTIENAATASTDYKLTVTKQVYVGDYQVYAYDTTSGTYQAKGAYTYYFALFSDSARTKKVSNVVSLDVSGFTGTVTFSNLTENGVYYLSETDQYGIVKTSTSSLTIRYTNSGKVTMSDTTRSMVAQNVYTSLPGGYRYTGTLSLTLNVTDSSGTAEAVTNTFYLGIYRNSDYSDTPTIVKMSLSNASSVTVRRRILLSGENSMTYYIAEVDSSGNRITDSSTFSYVVSVDKPTVTISKGSTQSVTVTNKLKASKVTLYLTKRVYEGTTQKAVSETFYVGLFKDADLTELYADPIAMKLDNASEKTLKLTLNLGSASGVTIYIAEVDKDGNVITDQRSFGYQIKVVNATAAFTQDNLSIQTVLLNSVYGSTSSDDWDSILSTTSSDLLTDTSYYTVSDNGSVSGETTSVETGDNTPLFGYVLLMGVAFLVLALSAGRRRRLMR